MDDHKWLDFIASLAHAWPLVVLLIVVVLHRPLGALIRAIEAITIKRGDTEISISRVKSVEAALPLLSQQVEIRESAAGSGSVEVEPGSPFSVDMDTAALEDPTGTIIRTWSFVERKLNEAIAADRKMSYLSMRRAIGEAVDRGVLSREASELFTSLRRQRNDVAHRERAVPVEEAVGYVRLARLALNQLPESPAR